MIFKDVTRNRVRIRYQHERNIRKEIIGLLIFSFTVVTVGAFLLAFFIHLIID